MNLPNYLEPFVTLYVQELEKAEKENGPSLQISDLFNIAEKAIEKCNFSTKETYAAYIFVGFSLAASDPKDRLSLLLTMLEDSNLQATVDEINFETGDNPDLGAFIPVAVEQLKEFQEKVNGDSLIPSSGLKGVAFFMGVRLFYEIFFLSLNDK